MQDHLVEGDVAEIFLSEGLNRSLFEFEAMTSDESAKRKLFTLRNDRRTLHQLLSEYFAK